MAHGGWSVSKGRAESAPVFVWTIKALKQTCRSKGIHVTETERFSTLSAAIAVCGETASIALRASLADDVKLFLLAHQLGHLALGHLRPDVVSSVGCRRASHPHGDWLAGEPAENLAERQADAWAGQLLLPPVGAMARNGREWSFSPPPWAWLASPGLLPVRADPAGPTEADADLKAWVQAFVRDYPLIAPVIAYAREFWAELSEASRVPAVVMTWRAAAEDVPPFEVLRCTRRSTPLDGSSPLAAGDAEGDVEADPGEQRGWVLWDVLLWCKQRRWGTLLERRGDAVKVRAFDWDTAAWPGHLPPWVGRSYDEWEAESGGLACLGYDIDAAQRGRRAGKAGPQATTRAGAG